MFAADVKSRFWSLNEAVRTCHSGANAISVLCGAYFPGKKFRKTRKCLCRYATLVPELVWLRCRHRSVSGLDELLQRGRITPLEQRHLRNSPNQGITELEVST